VIVGFAIGCGIGALCEATFGVRSLALPTGLALLAFAMGSAVEADRDAYPDGVSNIARAAVQRVDY
jgi:hypothetical protein